MNHSCLEQGWFKMEVTQFFGRHAASTAAAAWLAVVVIAVVGAATSVCWDTGEAQASDGSKTLVGGFPVQEALFGGFSIGLLSPWRLTECAYTAAECPPTRLK